MESLSKVCVYNASSVGEADVIVAWLEEQGIGSYVKDRFSVGTVAAPLIVEVCVFDAKQADAARELLSAHQQKNRDGHRGPAGNEVVTATCEECGNASAFPFSQAGTVQSCPVCREFVDVPEVGAK